MAKTQKSNMRMHFTSFHLAGCVNSVTSDAIFGPNECEACLQATGRYYKTQVKKAIAHPPFLQTPHTW